MKDYGVGRDDGLALALRLVESGGIEALRKEIKDRGIHGIHTSYAEKELWQKEGQIKKYLSSATCVVSATVLIDDFGHGDIRLGRFANGFDREIEKVLEDPAYLQECLDRVKAKGLNLRL